MERENLISEHDMSTYLWETCIGVSSVDCSMVLPSAVDRPCIIVHRTEIHKVRNNSCGALCYGHARRQLKGLGWDLGSSFWETF